MDGSEIQESVLTLLAIRKAGASYQCFAPDSPQHHVSNHLTQEMVQEERNVLVESARIARGQILPLSEYNAAAFDALVLPGGFGAAANLSDFIDNGDRCSVQADVENAVKATHAAGKPIGALCIAPVVLGRLLPGVELTIGNDAAVNAALRNMGASPVDAGPTDIVIDAEQKVVTSPCYMYDSSIDQIAEGAERAVGALIKLLKKAQVST